MKYVCLLTVVILISIGAFPQKRLAVTSPDGRIECTVGTTSSAIHYRVTYGGRMLVAPSKLQLTFASKSDSDKPRIKNVVHRNGSEEYTLTVGKRNHVHSRYREMVLAVTAGIFQYDIIVRAFDDGVAWRYVMTSGEADSFNIKDELNEFRLQDNPQARTLLLPNYTTSHEGYYTKHTVESLPADTLIDMPALFEWNNGVCMAITEAALLDYAGMYLSKRNGVLRSVLSPLPKNPSIKVSGKYPHNSPWRVLMIGDNIGTLISSDILTNLNAPPAYETGWLQTGKTTFPWWNGNVMPDTINAPGNNLVTQQYYIDFCARNNIQFHTVVEYGLHQWYVDDGVGFQPGPHNDVTKPVPGLDMKEVCDYAASKGVGVRVWVHWAALYPRIDSAFSIFEQWGLKGMMIDFMDRDDQEMVNIQTEMLQKAAKHHLHVQFHGAYKPTGLSRTYPNELTREGAMNYEYNKWGKTITADHDLNIVFTRMLAGPTDYHMGGFRFVKDSAFRAQYTRPLIMSTKAHMLGMYVVLENYLGMVADFPEAYEGKEGFDFIRTVPTTWDDTKVVAAKTDQYAVIARKKDGKWWLGAINSLDKKTIDISLAFLGNEKYKAVIYTDDDSTDKDPNHLTIKSMTVSGSDRLSLNMSDSGGAAISFEIQLEK